MLNESLHEILVCTNPDCAIRFPLSPTEKRITRCPRCGAPLQLAEAPYHSFSVPVKETGLKKRSFTAVLDNIRSTYNVGAMFRTSDGAGIDKLYLCGITTTPDNLKIKKTALGAEISVPWEHSWSVVDVANGLKKAGFMIVALEGGNSAVNLFEALPGMRNDDRPLALVVGNEVSGVDPEVIALCDQTVFIPMEGVKESLNVAVAFGIAAYLIRYQGL